MDTSGKDKKRIRDRKAQREHRKRQKTYVEGLEAQIEKLSNIPTSERSGVLWGENEKLRQQVSAKANLEDVILNQHADYDFMIIAQESWYIVVDHRSFDIWSSGRMVHGSARR
jgi:hypothetical protein